MTAEDYYDGVVAGRINDPTLSMQLGVGFEPRGAARRTTCNDPVCDNYSVLLVLDADQGRARARRETQATSLHPR